MKRRVLVVAIAIGLVLVGCSLLVDTKGLVGSAPDAAAFDSGQDGGASGDGSVDAAVDAPATDGATTGDASTGCDWTSPFSSVVRITELCSSSDDETMRFTPDELVAYLTSKRGDGTTAHLYAASRKSVTDPFGTPVPLAGLGAAQNDFQASVTADGLLLFFDSDRPDGGVRHIYSASRTSPTIDFSNVTVHDEIGNATDNHYRSFATADGLVLYYSGPVDDVFRAQRASTSAPFGAGVAVGELKTSASDDFAVVTPDDMVVYFDSARPGGAGNGDIWTARRPAPGMPFGAPVRVVELSSSDEDVPSWISADLCRFYFYSNRPGGSGGHDVYLATRSK